ncbi:MAG: hypothetical protein AAF420_00165 [Pseudomonadota bacterium]
MASLLAALLACVPQGDAPAGLHDIAVQTEHGEQRFTLSIPDNADSGTQPLVLALHYGGSPSPFYGRGLIEQLIGPGFSALNAYIVAPETTGGDWSTDRNAAYIEALLHCITTSYDIDSAKIILTGYSMGAMGTWHFLKTMPNQFSAAVPIAGFGSSLPESSVPTFTLAAPRDEIFPLDRLQTMLKQRPEIVFEEVDANGHFDLPGFIPALREKAIPWIQKQWETTND